MNPPHFRRQHPPMVSPIRIQQILLQHPSGLTSRQVSEKLGILDYDPRANPVYTILRGDRERFHHHMVYGRHGNFRLWFAHDIFTDVHEQ